MGHVPPFAHFPGGALPVADLDHLLHIAPGVSVLQRLDDHGRVHQARKDAVGPDVLVGILQGNALGESEDSGFGCGVGHVGNAQVADPCDGRDIAEKKKKRWKKFFKNLPEINKILKISHLTIKTQKHNNFII